MPIPALIRRLFYSNRSGWPEIRYRILERARHHCERCGKPNAKVVWTLPGGIWLCRKWERWRAPGSLLVDLRPPLDRGVFVGVGDFDCSRLKPVFIVLTIAHLNHKPGDDRDENLAAWCQWCHLDYDLGKHADTRKERKDRARPLLTDMPLQNERRTDYLSKEVDP